MLEIIEIISQNRILEKIRQGSLGLGEFSSPVLRNPHKVILTVLSTRATK